MASYNRIILVGNLTRDPQLSYTSSNVAVCKFGIATNNKWKDREGNLREDVCFVDCTVFGRAGETFNQYMKKGQPALIEGRLQLNQWTTPEGEKRSRHEVLVDNFTFLGGGQRSEGVPRGGDVGGRGEMDTPPAPAYRGSGAAPSRAESMDPHPMEDIPF